MSTRFVNQSLDKALAIMLLRRKTTIALNKGEKATNPHHLELVASFSTRRLLSAAYLRRVDITGNRMLALQMWVTCITLLLSTFRVGPLSAADKVETLFQSSCIECHETSTDTPLDLTMLKRDLADAETFRQWVRIYDRVQRGEMPPPTAPQLEKTIRTPALTQLKAELTQAGTQRQQTVGRVPSRRLSRLEYEHTLHDLLGIGGDLARYLPPENSSDTFDTVAAKQEMSSVHVRGLLKVADLAIEEAVQLGPRPRMQPRELDYFNSPYIQMWVDRPVRRGGGTVFKTERDVVTFRGLNYVLRSDANGYRIPLAGQYRITVKAAAYQPYSSITLSLKRQNDTQGESELFAAWDLVGDRYREVSVTKYLRPDDYFYVSADELDPAPDGRVIYNSQPASKYRGEGIRIRRVIVEGPLENNWPPARTRQLFGDMKWEAKGKREHVRYVPLLSDSPKEHTRSIVTTLARRAFRRDVDEQEIDRLVALAEPGFASERSFVECVRIPLRSILVSPEVLFLTGDAGALDDRDLASRLSYFLWRSIPDEELNQLTDQSQLTNSKTLAAQVDRLLDDPKSDRFVREFVDQWLGLDRIDATTPDPYLYPEYDDVLRRAMLAETREFIAYLIDEDLPVVNLVDSDFTFLNRRLAEHYGIEGVNGEQMRKVVLPPNSVRGGLLSQASIAKVTANGTVTSPVRRGNFVLTKLLGQPPSPPPPGVGAIEPDTRGATTIREMLDKHQSVPSCAVCHHRIDPPGFALECFDPVGHFRQRYRNSKGVQRTASVGLRFRHKDYELGLPVDSSGEMEDGFHFENFQQYRMHLRSSEKQVARNLLSKLIAFATGAEVQFADRDEVERILQLTQDDGYPLRSLIHHVVASRMFRNR